MRKKRVVILGSTGSIGINTLKVVRRYREHFDVVGLSAFDNVRLLSKQIREFKPKFAAIRKEKIAKLKKESAGRRTRFFDVEEDLNRLVEDRSVDIVVIGMRGSIALAPFLAAVKKGKRVAPANKEALVIAGEIIMREARRNGAEVIPVDSEQSAIFQCLQGQGTNSLKKIHLTASGGALLNVPRSRFSKLSVKQILRHPRWKMGKKITVDSATLMNKGFEIIEAIRLFDLEVSRIDVVVHPEAIVHSMVEFEDGSVIAQLGVTDMRLPIQYALTYPKRFATGLRQMNFAELGQLNFQKPDHNKFPSLLLASRVAKKGGTFPSVLNGANEEAVEAFLSGKLPFDKIFCVVEKVVRKHKAVKKPNLKHILQADRWSREEAERLIVNGVR